MIRGLALCAGAGGLELGLRLCLGDAYRCVGYVEREAFAAATLVARMEGETLDRAPVWDDLTTFDCGPWRGRVDLVSAGFPCQPSSAAGHRRGAGDERWLWPDVARVVDAVAPGLVFVENVPGLFTVDGGAGFHQVVEDLSALGFDAEWDCFAAAEVGASQLRERLFLLAYRNRRGLRRVRVGGPLNGFEPAPGHDADRRDQHVAHAERDWRQRSGDVFELAAAPRGEQGQALQRQRSRNAAGDGGQVMADVGRRRRRQDLRVLLAPAGQPQPDRRDQNLSRRARCEGTVQPPLAAGRGPFPPGPRACNEWAAVLAENPELAPAFEPRLRGVADGLAGGMVDRTDRLRLLGNGVVPLVAAVAFLALAARAGLDLAGGGADA